MNTIATDVLNLSKTMFLALQLEIDLVLYSVVHEQLISRALIRILENNLYI
jgi:hypothetical protein